MAEFQYNDYKQVFNNAFFCLGNAIMYLSFWILFHNKFADYFNGSGNRRDKFVDKIFLKAKNQTFLDVLPSSDNFRSEHCLWNFLHSHAVFRFAIRLRTHCTFDLSDHSL